MVLNKEMQLNDWVLIKNMVQDSSNSCLRINGYRKIEETLVL